jgi:hypothetical protein
VPADVLSILRPAKADILRILKWRDPAQAPFGVRWRSSEAQWDTALFIQRHFLDGGWGARAIEFGWREDELFAMLLTSGAPTNAASVCWSVKTRSPRVTAEAIAVESVRHIWLHFYGAKVFEVTGWAFSRLERDNYATPAAAVAPLLDWSEQGSHYIEPCCGEGEFYGLDQCRASPGQRARRARRRPDGSCSTPTGSTPSCSGIPSGPSEIMQANGRDGSHQVSGFKWRKLWREYALIETGFRRESISGT